MKNVLILHGKGATPDDNWFPWLKTELEDRGYKVWVPQLPNADQPDEKAYNEMLLGSDFEFEDAVLIGHSAGAVAALKLLPHLPDTVRVKRTILVGGFTDKLAQDPEWADLKGLFHRPFDFDGITSHCPEFIIFHSEDDPLCPIEQAEYLHEKLPGEFVRFTNRGHFSNGHNPEATKLPELLNYV